jgi:hypothetical protein
VGVSIRLSPLVLAPRLHRGEARDAERFEFFDEAQAERGLEVHGEDFEVRVRELRQFAAERVRREVA